MTADATSAVIDDGAGGLEVAGATDRGTVRTENQDMWTASLVRTPLAEHDGHAGPPRAALVLADGMGGHSGGREAAEAAVEAAAARIVDPGPSRQQLEAAVAEASAAVAGVRDLLGGEPGTTLVLALVDGERATIASVGDSRAYRIRDGAAEQLTHDHSWVGEELRAGRISAAESRHHPRRNIITRAVMGDAVSPDIIVTDVRPADTLLLCSDGVWEPLSDEMIAGLLTDGGPLVRDLERLCEAALDAGGRDNVTAVAARIGPSRGVR